MANIKISELPGNQNHTGKWIGNTISPSYGGTGVNNGSNAITINGNVTFSGNHSSTFIISGPTAITFPISGTLINNNVSELSNLSSIGTIINGIWNATPIEMSYGGMNASLIPSNGGIFYSTGNGGAILPGTSGAQQMLQSGANSAPSWSITTWPQTIVANNILYSSSNNVVGTIASSANSILITDDSGVPHLSSTLPSEIIIPNVTLSNVSKFSGGQVHHITLVNVENYSALDSDFILACNRAGEISIQLISSPILGNIYRIKDISGEASVNKITITPASGTIDGLSMFIIDFDYQSVDLIYTGSEWSVF